MQSSNLSKFTLRNVVVVVVVVIVIAIIIIIITLHVMSVCNFRR